MKLLLFTPKLCSGGAQQVAILLSSGLISLGHDVHIAAPSLQGELVHRVKSKCHLEDLQATKPIHAQKQLATLVNTLKPDAVICFGIYTGIAATLSRRMWRSSPILLIRNENNLTLDWREGTILNRFIGPPLSRWAARHAQIIAVSEALRKPTADYLRLPSSRVHSILNPVIDDTAPTSLEDTAHLHPWLQNSQRPTLVAMGRLEHQKGFDTLIDAFALASNETNARLIIFGQGSLRKTLQEKINAYGLGQSIDLAGHTNYPIEQMRFAHTFVLSSRFEGFGLVLVEAMLAGTNVISTNCDFGPAELLENGRYGKLVPVDDTQALADAMLQSIQEPWTAERPSEAWFSQFTASEAARQHLALIEKLRGASGNLS